MVRGKRLAAFLCSTAVAVTAVYWFGGQVPRMESPIDLGGAGALADGGTTWVELSDVNGRRIRLEIRGRLAGPATFHVYMQPWYPWFPVPFEIEQGSQAERELALLIDQATADNPTKPAYVWSLRAIGRVSEIRRNNGRNAPAAT